MKRLILAGLLAVAAAPSTAQAVPPQVISPPDGAVFSIDSTIEFVAQAPRFAAVRVVIAVRPDLNPEGYLARAFIIDDALMDEADASGTLYREILQPSVIGWSRPAYRPGTYYWQAWGTFPMQGDFSPVRSFTLQPAPLVGRPGFQCERAQNQLRRQRSALARHNRAHRRRPTASTKRRIARAREQVRRYQRQVARFC